MAKAAWTMPNNLAVEVSQSQSLKCCLPNPIEKGVQDKPQVAGRPLGEEAGCTQQVPPRGRRISRSGPTEFLFWRIQRPRSRCDHLKIICLSRLLQFSSYCWCFDISDQTLLLCLKLRVPLFGHRSVPAPFSVGGAFRRKGIFLFWLWMYLRSMNQ